MALVSLAVLIFGLLYLALVMWYVDILFPIDTIIKGNEHEQDNQAGASQWSGDSHGGAFRWR